MVPVQMIIPSVSIVRVCCKYYTVYYAKPLYDVLLSEEVEG